MATPEGKVKAKLDRMLKEEGVPFFSPQAGPYGGSGVHDRILCVSGLFVTVETKADAKKKPTALQLRFGDIFAEGGAHVFYVYGDDDIAVLRRFIVAVRSNPKLQSPGYQHGRPARDASSSPKSQATGQHTSGSAQDRRDEGPA